MTRRTERLEFIVSLLVIAVESVGLTLTTLATRHRHRSQNRPGRCPFGRPNWNRQQHCAHKCRKLEQRNTSGDASGIRRRGQHGGHLVVEAPQLPVVSLADGGECRITVERSLRPSLDRCGGTL